MRTCINFVWEKGVFRLNTGAVHDLNRAVANFCIFYVVYWGLDSMLVTSPLKRVNSDDVPEHMLRFRQHDAVVFTAPKLWSKSCAVGGGGGGGGGSPSHLPPPTEPR
ncbi:unnamed protein product [Mesocestoides corti]|uniref:EXS domain-containing protein n=1 Tax=Mesocestoides corti TaxID=53468 RepID=A0A0R3UEG3_MESCO|nr:unnamed protein product [Mesocestoides corti]